MGCGNTRTTQEALLGECAIPDIGCVAITDGAPTVAPNPDHLPFAYDPATESLWLYQCDEGPWTEIKHETLCDIPNVNILTITDVCNNLNIPITYDDCTEGRVSLTEFASKIKECLDLRTICELDFLGDVAVDAATSVAISACVDNNNVLINPFTSCRLPVINQAAVDGATLVQVNACVDGVDNLIPYIPEYTMCSQPLDTLPNLLTLELAVCNNGSDGLVPADSLAPNLCNIASLTSEAVLEGASVVQYAVCSDGITTRVPWLPRFTVCELPVITQGAVDGAGSVTMAACVDGVDNLIPVPPAFVACDLPVINQAAVDGAASVTMVACVDGVDNLIPYIPEFTLCGLTTEPLPNILATQLAACVDGDDRLIPVDKLIPNVCNIASFSGQPIVDAGTTVQGIVCLDGVTNRVPYVPPICSLDSINQAAVDGASTVETAACVDGVNNLIPYIPAFTTCGLPTDSQVNLDAATLIEVAACVDGVETKISIAQLKLLLV